MKIGAKGEIPFKAKLTQTLLYSANHLDYSDKNYSKIKRIFFSK